MTKPQSNFKPKAANFGHWPLVIGHFQKGFTIIEAVTAMGVFAVAVTSILGVYLSVQRLNQASSSLQALQLNGRYIVEDMAKIIRNGQINYVQYGGSVPQPSTLNLYLIDRDGAAIWIRRSGNSLLIDKSGNSSNFTGSDVRVVNFYVYIWPSTNPFPKGAASPKEQPTVTIFLDLESNVNTKDKSRAQFQTTVSTREYSQ